jgi:hypothetical protein
LPATSGEPPLPAAGAPALGVPALSAQVPAAPALWLGSGPGVTSSPPPQAASRIEQTAQCRSFGRSFELILRTDSRDNIDLM